MIPKVIHYCWFGYGEKPKTIEKCIKSWKKYCPDYEIKEWTEDDFDISSAPLYVRQAYKARKWAFVSDYARLWIIYNYGGIYLDTDIELIKNIDDLLYNRAYFGFESGNSITTGIGFAAEKGFDLIKNLMGDYDEIRFLNEDGTFNMTPCTFLNLHCFTDYGFVLNNELQTVNGCTVYPSEYFSPKNYEMYKPNITPNTYSVHHYSLSWKTESQRKERIKENRRYYYKSVPKKLVRKILGNTFYSKIKNIRYKE